MRRSRWKDDLHRDVFNSSVLNQFFRVILLVTGISEYLSAQLMKNSGMVFANDKNKLRTKALVANVHRLGCSNVVISNYDGRSFPTIMGGFDRVLLGKNAFVI